VDSGHLLRSAQAEAAARVAEPGDWLTGEQRVAVWREVRATTTNPPDLARQVELLPAAGVEVVRRLATDPGRLTRSWAERSIAEVGEETYVELVGVTAIVTVLDWFSRAMGEPERPLPEPASGQPARLRPGGVGDVGAWVSQRQQRGRANVSRALSLVPVTESAWAPLVDTHYSRGAEFLLLAWDRSLSRPQVELVAARTTALNECFY
jgi:hypothetical protein